MYVAIIFDSGIDEGTEGTFVFGSNIVDVRFQCENVVNRDNSENLIYEWTENTFYPVGANKYGDFPWAKVYSAEEYETVRFSEYSG